MEVEHEVVWNMEYGHDTRTWNLFNRVYLECIAELYIFSVPASTPHFFLPYTSPSNAVICQAFLKWQQMLCEAFTCFQRLSVTFSFSSFMTQIYNFLDANFIILIRAWTLGIFRKIIVTTLYWFCFS